MIPHTSRASLVLPIVLTFLALSACTENTGHTHEHADANEHESHATDEHAHGEHTDDIVRLTPEQLERAGVVIKPLSGGVVATHVTLPAEVGLNEDAVVHVTPRVPGIVSSVAGFLGQDVSPGDMLAVIESPELGEAKIAYLQAVQAEVIADAELERQRTISENTATLLSLLREGADSETLRAATADLRIGANKGRLLSAHARVRAARANLERERGLHARNLSTEAELLASQEAFDSAQAEYAAAFEEIDFTYRARLDQAERAAHVAASAAGNAERRLHLLGLTHDQITAISNEPDTDVARYELKAPIGGRVVAKHISPGEKVTSDAPVYTIADLGTVWLNISVYTAYADRIRQGQPVVVRAGDRTTTGVVDYVSAVVTEATRTRSARVVLPNEGLAWMPGEFVTAHVETAQAAAERIVPLDAVQTFEGQTVVFVQGDDGIEPVPVRLGRRNETSVELLGNDIELGTPIVVENSFLMKAELGKSAAGHDH